MQNPAPCGVLCYSKAMTIAFIILLAILSVFAGLGASAIMAVLKFAPSVIRKISHLGAMALIIVIAVLFGYKLFIVVGIVFAVLLLAIKFIHPPKALKNKEARNSYGEIFFFVGVTLTALIANSTSHFVIPIAILGLADTAAYIFGRSIKSPKLLFSKSLAGSLAFMIVAFLLLLIVTPWWVALIGGAVTAIAELVGLRGSDNVTIPVVAVLILSFV